MLSFFKTIVSTNTVILHIHGAVIITPKAIRKIHANTFQRSRCECTDTTSKSKPSIAKVMEVDDTMTLKQACSSEYQGAQGAFKDSMIHWILQFTLLIAFRCVLHRCESQEIRCWKLYLICLLAMMTFLTEAFVLRHRRGFQNRLAKVSLSHQAYNKCTGVWEWNEPGVHIPLVEVSYNPFQNSIMILPQVHLRKPCYDFYFL